MKKRILVLSLCAATCLSLVACGGGDSSSAGSSGSAQQPESSDVSTSSTSESTSTVEVEPDTSEVAPLSVGESAELGNWSVSVTGFEFSTRIDNGYGYFEPGEGNQYGVVSASITNNGTEADSFLPSFGFGDDVVSKIIYDGQYEYSSAQLLAYDADLHDEFLNPLSSASGVIVFELPESVVNGSESLTIDFTSGSDSIAFTLR